MPKTLCQYHNRRAQARFKKYERSQKDNLTKFSGCKTDLPVVGLTFPCVHILKILVYRQKNGTM